MKLCLKSILGISVFALFLLFYAHAQERPNIIWLMAEDIGTDIESYGMKGVKTPNLNRLAEEGIQYNRAYSTNPICSPSRSAMLVGVHQNRINAHHHRGNRDIPLPEPYRPFTYWLRQAGYTTILGHSKVLKKGRKVDVNFRYTDLGEWDGREQFGLFDKYDEFTAADQPFFSQIQLAVTHRGDWWDEIREKSSQPVNPEEIELPSYMVDHPVIRHDWAKYLDQIEYMDYEVGLLIEELKEKGLYENTVIIFIGENGRSNIRGKGYLYEPGINVPLIVSGPIDTKGGQIEERLVSTIDITATILNLAGIEIPEYMDGKSILRKDFQRDYIYSSRDRWDGVLDKSRSLTTRRYKYIRNDMPEVSYDAYHPYLEFHRPARHIMRRLNIDNELSEEERLFFSQTKPKEELYDLKNDPEELVNLAGKPEYAQVLEKMRTTLRKEESYNTSEETVYHAQPSTSSKIIKYVMYKYPEAYLRMLQGELIGYQKFLKLYKEHKQKNLER